MATNPFPPRPSVEHLLTVFRRIDAGKILIPAFQRTFVWRESQILDLLESVYSGYPVGSILLWNVDREILKVSSADDIPFPKGKPTYPLEFVLDGLQRLSSLYGVFHFGSSTQNAKFNVGFDLAEKRFAYAAQFDGDPDLFVPLSALFNPRSLLDVQQTLLEKKESDDLIQVVLELQSRFQEYMIPLVTLTERDPTEVVSIFERVNSTGTRLSRVDFMRAITWSSNFDLNDALSDISTGLDELGFDISDDTIVKALGLTFELDPLPNVMLQLREKSAKELSEAVDETKHAFTLAVRFLKEHLRILGSDFVPYEGQLLTLFNVFRRVGSIDDQGKESLKHWFFSMSVSEALQGRPDHYVAKLIRSITNRMIHGTYDEFRSDVLSKSTPSRRELGSKKMIKGKALSTAFTALLGERHARSLVNGRTIPLEEYLRAFDTANFMPIFSKGELPAEFGGDISSAKILANIVLIPPSDADALKAHSAHDILSAWYNSDEAVRHPTLQSQLLPIDGRLFQEGRVSDFLEVRSAIILNGMLAL